MIISKMTVDIFTTCKKNAYKTTLDNRTVDKMIIKFTR